MLVGFEPGMNIALKFEEGSWTRTYQEGVQQRESGNGRFTHLQESCEICSLTFTPADQVIVPSCLHTLHKRCFTPWKPQTCPTTGARIEVTKTVSLLGFPLTFPTKALQLAVYVESNQDEINEVIKNAVDLPITNNEKFRLQGLLIQNFFQHILNIYAFEGTDLRKEISKSFEDFQTHWVNLVAYVQENNEFVVSEKHWEDIVRIKTFFNDNERRQFLIDLMTSIIFKAAEYVPTIAHNTIDTRSMGASFAYIFKVSEMMLNHFEVIKIVEEADRKFFEKHFEKIEKLPSNNQRYSYLTEMASDQLQRLNRLTQTSEPISLEIRRNIKNIEAHRNGINFLKKTAIVTLLVAAFALIQFNR